MSVSKKKDFIDDRKKHIDTNNPYEYEDDGNLFSRVLYILIIAGLIISCFWYLIFSETV